MTETCVICCTAQPISTMRRDSAAWECADEIACLARRHDLITVMQRGLDRAWQVLDELARDGQTDGSDAGEFAEQRPAPGNSSGPSSGLPSHKRTEEQPLSTGFSFLRSEISRT